MSEDGGVVITKVEGSGGRVTVATCTEQLLYEIHDPAEYTTPDVVADFSGVSISEIACDRVRVDGARGRARTDTLKVSLGYDDGFVGEGQISYAGSGATARAKLARSIVEARMGLIGVRLDDMRCDLIGIDALHGGRLAARRRDPYEVTAHRWTSAYDGRRDSRRQGGRGVVHEWSRRLGRRGKVGPTSPRDRLDARSARSCVLPRAIRGGVT
jgi:hypothetical protein